MTQHAIGIGVSNQEEGELILQALHSEAFSKVRNACIWSSFALEWSMFKNFRKDFYKILLECDT